MMRNELTPKQRQLCLAYLETGRLTQAARRVGVSYATAQRWWRQPAVRAELRRLADEQTQEVVQELRNAARSAATLLRQVIEQGTEPLPWRLRAAQTVLAVLGTLEELYDLHERVAALEAAAGADRREG
ncbi:MAG: terminase small subunit [Thermomicrobium sp.]|nr:terminase small subunit [Thermomicrobium sp.]